MTRSSSGDGHAIRQARRLETWARGAVRPFRSDARVLNVVGTLHAAREAARTTDDAELTARLARAVSVAAARMHRALRVTPKSVPLARRVRENRLNHTETDCFLLLVLAGLGRGSVGTLGDAQAALAGRGGDAIRVLRALSPDGRLARRDLVCVDEDDSITDSRVRVHPEIVADLVGRRRTKDRWWDARTQAELLGRMRPLVRSLIDVAEQITENEPPVASQLARAVTRRDHLLSDFARALCEHNEWSLTPLFVQASLVDFGILLLLAGQELGHGTPRFNAFTGRALAASMSDDPDEAATRLRQLLPRGYLRREGLIRVCGGAGDVASADDVTAVATCSFELTQRAIKALELSTSARKRVGARDALVRLDQLVLSEEAMCAVRMAVAQATHADVLFRKWGIAEAIRYGRGTTLLFSGPPGTGKTATAEALAHELGRPVLPVNLAEIQSCWVGETEKAIVRAFREAQEAGAVLFFDEADAFFHDREQASRQWEVREVNVLLQEVERFEGVCVLATNRRTSLDAALERRITMKIEFARPDAVARRALWRKLLPPKLPLAADVDIDALAEHDLSGGQIKNVVLNAARRALMRGARATVSRADFDEGVRAESEGQWTGKQRLGFGAYGGGRWR